MAFTLDWSPRVIGEARQNQAELEPCLRLVPPFLHCPRPCSGVMPTEHPKPSFDTFRVAPCLNGLLNQWKLGETLGTTPTLASPEQCCWDGQWVTTQLLGFPRLQ